MNELALQLARHDFKTLFTEVLGWENASAEHPVEADGHVFTCRTIAQKRGVQVFVCETDRYSILNLARLRAIERQITRRAHEHIAIYTCAEQRKQVWQWSIFGLTKQRQRHREHPFFSDKPPARLLGRLQSLRFTLAEEEGITLVDALERVRLALDDSPDLHFVRRPKYAEQSDRLARAMRTGGAKELHDFVNYHIRLARWGGQLITGRIAIDQEDAEQIACCTLMRAARKFDPERGFQFSTYACTCLIRDATRCYREPFLMATVSPRAYRWFRQIKRLSSERFLMQGPDGAAECLNESLGGDAAQVRKFVWIEAVTSAETLPPFPSCHRRWNGLTLCDEQDGATGLHREATEQIIQSAIETLPSADQRLIKLRYGLGCVRRTLESVAQEFGLTKERIRQRQNKAVGIMLPHVRRMMGEPPVPVESKVEEEQSEQSAPVLEPSASQESIACQTNECQPDCRHEGPLPDAH
jgi:RNA polymerase sigma factor (sigma-70 family)